MANDFGVTVEELVKLNEKRGLEASEEIRSKFGDVNELCRRLQTSPTDGMTFLQCLLHRTMPRCLSFLRPQRGPLGGRPPGARVNA